LKLDIAPVCISFFLSFRGIRAKFGSFVLFDSILHDGTIIGYWTRFLFSHLIKKVIKADIYSTIKADIYSTINVHYM
jgi:hypothetical protein